MTGRTVQGRCVGCGAELPSGTKRVRCAYCVRDYKRAVHARWLADRSEPTVLARIEAGKSHPLART